ncbi:MAG: hypothetical protein J7M09_06135, partial [Deltaproteobacteria bacterium]|nr:hypothetical protein [Candidatus Tharpella sp.]
LYLDSDESSAEDSSLFQEGMKKQFDQDELGIYKLIDGKRSLTEVLNISTIGQFHTSRIVLDFLDRGIITPKTSGYSDYRPIKSSKSNNYLAGIALLLLGGALLISVAISIWNFERPRKDKKPTFFSAIIDNLRADQQEVRKQARELLHQKIDPSIK